MKPLPIDFASPGLARSLYRTRPAMWLMLGVGAGLCIASALIAWDLYELQRAQAAQLVAVQARAKPVAIAVVAQPLISDQQAAAVNGAVLQLNLPWRALHDAIGAATPKSVALLALEPDARKRSIKLTAEARTSDDMIGYVEKLKEQGLFAGVSLVRHEINEQDANRPIRFQIEARWTAP